MPVHRYPKRACALLLAVVALLPAASPAAQGAPPGEADIAGDVAEASQRFGIPEPWIWSVIRAESGGRIDAVSPAGAQGLMQIMPATWQALRARHGLGSDPFDPRDNVLAGTAYLRELHDRFGAPGFLAAYNAGPGRYEDWRDRGRPLPAETRNYVARLAPALQTASAAPAMPVQPAAPGWREGTLFARTVAGPETSVAAVMPGTAWPRPDRAASLFARVAGAVEQP